MSFLRTIKDKITEWLGHKALDLAMSSILKSLGIPNTAETQAALQQIINGALVLAAAYQNAKVVEPPIEVPPDVGLPVEQKALIEYVKKHPETIPQFIIDYPELAQYV